MCLHTNSSTYACPHLLATWSTQPPTPQILPCAAHEAADPQTRKYCTPLSIPSEYWPHPKCAECEARRKRDKEAYWKSRGRHDFWVEYPEWRVGVLGGEYDDDFEEMDDGAYGELDGSALGDGYRNGLQGKEIETGDKDEKEDR